MVLLSDPARQKKTVERRRQAKAAHMKPKAYLPIVALLPLERNASRPWTYATVIRMAVSIWKNNAIMFRKPEMYAPILVQRANRPVKKDRTAKKRPMRTKANMKRVR